MHQDISWTPKAEEDWQNQKPEKGSENKVNTKTLCWLETFNEGRSIQTDLSKQRGGGQQIVDFNEDLTLNQLISEITDIFFPNGMSEAKDLRLPGRCLRCAPGILFWLPNSRDRREWGVFYSWKLFKKMKSTPVRIYLHTELVSYKNF